MKILSFPFYQALKCCQSLRMSDMTSRSTIVPEIPETELIYSLCQCNLFLSFHVIISYCFKIFPWISILMFIWVNVSFILHTADDFFNFRYLSYTGSKYPYPLPIPIVKKKGRTIWAASSLESLLCRFLRGWLPNHYNRNLIKSRVNSYLHTTTSLSYPLTSRSWALYFFL